MQWIYYFVTLLQVNQIRANTKKIKNLYMKFNLFDNMIGFMEGNIFLNKMYGHNLIYIHVFEHC